jgi:glycosyltransferase involved in cell wall biosynthesis
MGGSTRPRRVLLFTSSPLEGGEGADKQLAAMIASEIPDMEFTWFTWWPARGSGPRLAVGHPVPIASRDGIPHAAERLQVTAAGALLARRHDLVHAILTVSTGFPRLSRWWPLLFPSRPLVHTVPGVMEPHLLSRSRPLGTTVAYSEVTARALRAAGFGDVRVIAPAVSQAQWPRLPRPAGIPVVLFAGHHDPGGGAVEAIAAAGVARRAGARFRLVLAMRLRPGQRGRALAADLVRLAGREGLHDVTVHGYVADMPGLLAATDVLLFIPRRLSGKADIPLTVLEALATSRPVIISDLPQVAGLGDAVLRAPAGDAQQAGLLLAGLLAEPRRWQAMAERGNAMVRARFGSQRCVAQYRCLYSELLG